MAYVRWMTGVTMGLALMASGGAAGAQSRPGASYQDSDDQASTADDLQPGYDAQDRVEEPYAPEQDSSADAGAAAEEDFSDVVAADRPQEEEQRQASPTLDAEAEAAANSCAIAARDEAEREGGYAEVRQMEEPRETRDGYDIAGDVEVRTGWRAQDGRVRHFTCTAANGRITDVYFRRDGALR